MQGGLLKGLRFPLSLHNQAQVYLGLYERETHDWIVRLTDDIHTFVDAGANNGQLSTFALAKTDARRVLAFEPEVFQHESIRIAARANDVDDADRLRIYSWFLGDDTGEDVRPLDAFQDEIAYPCFLKIDVEGGETEVLRGATSVLQEGECRLLVETHAEAKEDECRSILRRLGYTTQVIDHAWWRAILPFERPRDHNRWLIAHRAVE